MKPDPRFLRQPKHFWANVRSLSQKLRYTGDGGQVKAYSLQTIATGLESLNLSAAHVVNGAGKPTELGIRLFDYFAHRAKVLNEYVQPRLMDKERACQEFETMKARLNPRCPTPMVKQKGDKYVPAYLTGIVNMLVEAGIGGCECNYDPQVLPTITRDGAPVRTLSRRIDGAFPSTVNPIAVWEIKEYYNTTTFGSRVADGIYETLLDGMELEELSEHEGIHVRHYLMVDSPTWWDGGGRPYLCRIVDMLHMGYVDEVLFGYEVIEQLPGLVKEWVEILRARATG